MAEGIHEHDTDQKNSTDCDLAPGGEIELKYRLDRNEEQVAVTESTKSGLGDGNILSRFVAFLGAEQPGRRIVWLTGSRHAECTVDDQTGGIQNPTGCDTTVYKPASDAIGFEKPEIQQKER